MSYTELYMSPTTTNWNPYSQQSHVDTTSTNPPVEHTFAPQLQKHLLERHSMQHPNLQLHNHPPTPRKSTHLINGQIPPTTTCTTCTNLSPTPPMHATRLLYYRTTRIRPPQKHIYIWLLHTTKWQRQQKYNWLKGI